MKNAIILLVICLCFSAFAEDEWPDAPLATTNDVNRITQDQGQNIVYIQNDTFLANPPSLLGNVLVLRSNDLSSTRSNPVFELSGFQNFNVTAVPSGYDHTAVQSLLVNQQLSASSSFMSFFSADLSSSNVLNMTVRNELIQRIVDDSKWQAAYTTWKSNNTDLLADKNVSYILVVRGYVLKSINYVNYTQITGKASGAYGVSVNGSLYSSSSDNNISYLWGIDYGIIRGPLDSADAPMQLSSPRSPTLFENGEIFKHVSGKLILRQSM